MEWLFALTALLGFVAGWISKASASKPTSQTETIGTLRIETSDPDGPYLFLELDKGVGDISKEEYVRLRVSNESYITRN